MSLSDTLFDVLDEIEESETLYDYSKDYEEDFDSLKEKIWQLAQRIAAPPIPLAGDLPTWKEFKRKRRAEET